MVEVAASAAVTVILPISVELSVTEAKTEARGRKGPELIEAVAAGVTVEVDVNVVTVEAFIAW